MSGCRISAPIRARYTAHDDDGDPGIGSSPDDDGDGEALVIFGRREIRKALGKDAFFGFASSGGVVEECRLGIPGSRVLAGVRGKRSQVTLRVQRTYRYGYGKRTRPAKGIRA